MSVADHDPLFKRALAAYGDSAQEALAVGEIGELLNLFGRRVQGRDTPEDWIVEIADVTIMLRQLALMHGVEKVEEAIKAKCERLERRVQQAEAENAALRSLMP